MATRYSPAIVTSGLVLALDAANPKSYSGTGTTWSDLSGNSYDFTVNASAYSTSGGIPFMNFEGSYGIAKRIVGGALSDIPNYANATIVMFSSILNSTGNWRTLMRGANNDHQVIIQSGANTLGMYDNNLSGFLTAGFDVTNISNTYTKFNFLCWRLSQSSPYYQFQYNNNATVYSITDANATFNNGYACIGGYHNGTISTGAADSSQYWGKISSFYYYNRQLSSSEISQNYSVFKNKFGL